VTGPGPVGPGPVGVGIVGCGNIFWSYVLGLRKLGSVRVTGCADIDQDRAQAAAKAHDLRAYDSPGELMGDPEVSLVVNITPPAAHAAVTREALARGKHVFVEKPLAASLAEAGPVIAALARAPGRLGCAPDTFLAPAGQTARAAVDAGLIGEPIGVAAAIPHSRAEEWHPDPTFLFRAGAGPLLDMGPYYVATIVNCLGPVASVAGATRIGANPRAVTAPGRLVDTVSVEVPTHAVAVLTFVSGVIGTLTASFDIWSEHLPHIEIYGTEGILRIPNPDLFENDVTLKPNGREEWEVLPPVLSLGDFLPSDQRIRGLGVADLVDSLGGRPQRTSAELGHHVLEVLESIEVSSASGAVVRLTTAPARPARVDAGDLAGLAAAPAHV
jgi:predicted dehydrogenase